MGRRPERNTRKEGHHRLRRPSRSREKRRQSEEDSISTTSRSSASHRESQRTRGIQKSPISRKRCRWRSSSPEYRNDGCCHHRERCERRTGSGDEVRYRSRSEDSRQGAGQDTRRVRDDSTLGGGKLRHPCPTSLNAPAPPLQAPLTDPLPRSIAAIPSADLTANAPLSSPRAESRTCPPEELVQFPKAPAPRIEAIDERKQLFRTPSYPTLLGVPDARGVERRFEAFGASPIAAGVRSTDSVLGTPLLGVLPSPHPLQRPPTPALLPATGALPPPLSIAETVPFSEEDHLAWLCAPASPTESRASATVPPEVTAAHRGLARTDRVPLSQSEGERKHERSRRSGGVTAAQHSYLSSASAEVQGDAAPALVQDSMAAPTGNMPSASTQLGPQHREISYNSSFFLLTSWDALMAAPPLLHTTPRMPSLSAHDLVGIGPTVAQFSTFASSTHVRMSGATAFKPSRGSRDESLIDTSPAMEKGEGSQGREARTGTAQEQPAFPSVRCTPSPATSSPIVKCEGDECSREGLLCQVEEDGARTFVKHFTNGLVFVDPPWFICPTLLDNCEHPYYMTWLDELEVGSVEEAVTEAKAKLLADA
ncbi:hypothetical protein GH5_02658 [Leishmania sp. Ghana 2012 LV757]|uniref:hypothetical protein n=1 Tax=Leishmania sp. Ghana 2012 LV757 TaxID=2803181 RepID=UPI001B563EEE|nr:hypothetical protein GH5_02658 [Leishmania sp. Ghana 2012 LV757]